MTDKAKSEPIEIADDTPVVFVLPNGQRITVVISRYSGLRIRGERQLKIAPSDNRTIFVE